ARLTAGRAVRVWVDITNSPHAVIFRPLIARLEARGHEVTVTAREYAQTLGLLERFGIPHLTVGAHGGGGIAGKARAAGGRPAAPRRPGRRRAVRPRGRARIDGSAAGRAPGRHTAGDDVRLRVCARDAPLERPVGQRRARAGRDPRGGARPVRYAPAEAAPLP